MANHSTGVVMMSREKTSRPAPVPEGTPLAVTLCERCGAHIEPGAWPFCKGNPADHQRA